ncbi:hypothetical protein CJF32_00010841 [Rutstroemia sp. NJR-2017a WRK4]|nr:hypothetical protein CJF32_00010841 [Rutstroemia sp. NJR-2017a WRK4]
MKLIVAGSTGFVGTELIRQALSNPAIKSIAALARRETAVPENPRENADPSKLKSVVCDDFLNYPDRVKKELENADACIWLIAVTPSQLNQMTLDEARKICLDYTVAGIETITKLPRENSAKPFRFLYVSGAKTERDQTKKPWVLGDYRLMRGEAENRVLAFAQASNGSVEASVAKPGLILAPGRQGPVTQVLSTIGRAIIGLPKVDVSEISATLLDQAINGFTKETLENADLVEIGQRKLTGGEKSS